MRIPFNYEGAGFHLTREEDFIYQASRISFYQRRAVFYQAESGKFHFLLHEQKLRILLDE
jgi:hypothetical protein